MVVLLALDPYDTGRFALFGEHGVPRFGQRLADAGLARAQDVNAAIIGNSTIQLIDPARLGAVAGLHMISLAIPGTGPREQLAVARWLLRHHPGAQLRGLVLGLDATWCRGDGRLPLANPFPFWLYGDSTLDYALSMMRMQSFDAAGRKIKLLLGRAEPAPADGYSDYDRDRVWDVHGLEQRLDDEAGEPETPSEAGPDLAAIPLLARFLGELPPQTALVLVFPPRHHKALPPPDSPAARRLEACKAGVSALVARRPRTRVIDFARDGDIAEHDENFWDGIHYRSPVARLMEGEIAISLGEARQASETP